VKAPILRALCQCRGETIPCGRSPSSTPGAKHNAGGEARLSPQAVEKFERIARVSVADLAATQCGGDKMELLQGDEVLIRITIILK
jgi:hypothetical protein